MLEVSLHAAGLSPCRSSNAFAQSSTFSMRPRMRAGGSVLVVQMGLSTFRSSALSIDATGTLPIAG